MWKTDLAQAVDWQLQLSRGFGNSVFFGNESNSSINLMINIII